MHALHTSPRTGTCTHCVTCSSTSPHVEAPGASFT